MNRYVANILTTDETPYADIAAEQFDLSTEHAMVLVSDADTGEDVAAISLDRPLWRIENREFGDPPSTHGARAEATRALTGAGWRILGKWHDESEMIRAEVTRK